MYACFDVMCMCHVTGSCNLLAESILKRSLSPWSRIQSNPMLTLSGILQGGT